VFPELIQQQDFVAKSIREEEEGFLERWNPACKIENYIRESGIPQFPIQIVGELLSDRWDNRA
jgi:hypothetical protein